MRGWPDENVGGDREHWDRDSPKSHNTIISPLFLFFGAEDKFAVHDTGHAVVVGKRVMGRGFDSGFAHEGSVERPRSQRVAAGSASICFTISPSLCAPPLCSESPRAASSGPNTGAPGLREG